MSNRRDFIKTTTKITGSTLLALPLVDACVNDAGQALREIQGTASNINIVGPREGYTPHVGTLVSMLNWMRGVMLQPVRGMSVSDLDFLLDDNSNSIGAMLWHLAATERFYQINTFDGKRWEGLSSADEAKWDYASNLGDNGRRHIKGYDLDFYLDLLENVRNFTLEELKSKDDDWLMITDNNFWSDPTNNYCKWFHVCEHESNHNGQFKYIRSRIV